MSTQYKKLIMVAVNNGSSRGATQSNKYYEMIYNGGSTFTAKYGRVEATETVITKPYSEWNSVYNSKVKKGYKDVTDFVSVQVDKNQPVDATIATGDSKVDEFLSLMKRYTDNLVSTTYSVKATNVTQKQIDEAQDYINRINDVVKSKANTDDVVNSLLVHLYTVIPRKMRNVKDHLLPTVKLDKILQQEQDNLDAMASQVAQIAPKKDKTLKKKTNDFLASLGIAKMETSCARDYSKDIQYLLDQRHGKRVEAIFECTKPEEDTNIAAWMKDKKNKTTKILIHGTRCTSVIPILEQGLKIRPAGNFQFSGKAYGDGNYFSEVMQKSLNYTGNDNDKVLLVYEVHTGNPFVYDGWYRGNSFPLNLKELSSRGI
jgi:poly [ADP-ribose] polymerase